MSVPILLTWMSTYMDSQESEYETFIEVRKPLLMPTGLSHHYC